MTALIGIEVFCRKFGFAGFGASSYVGLRNREPRTDLRTDLM
ncbi:Hypothetical protein DEACI_0699 [Acididesulfobacillus acetoxydans]|uniref:Uncharacterized protein n=1 Tax=Acididesulfobacillus acetoxydans TaxID=1561005 RepID=A0A8S0X3F6_9FIRM|nr:hypothetical protein [Acididesulfobacillus acetoxydans]CAA7600050.1 Hypothetical protein DEACI_0699 [Acididesulfobacillus acetoxydans]CEJ07825.1 Hypothetical protein DEACI_2291 [Acididesulfobacillus acetoxydans]